MINIIAIILIHLENPNFTCADTYINTESALYAQWQHGIITSEQYLERSDIALCAYCDCLGITCPVQPGDTTLGGPR